LVAYALAVLGIGYHYSRRQRTTEEYFVGGRKMSPFLAGISIFTATTSIIAYIGIPGEYIQYGPGLVFFAALAPIPFIQLVAGGFIIPRIMRIPITSAYELLEDRLGRWVRRTGSLIFIGTRFIWMALILYAAAGVLVHVVGCDPRWAAIAIVITGLVTMTYTLLGGIRTVMITEVVQFFMLLAGAVLTLISISVRLGGIRAWWPSHWESHWQPQPLFSLDPRIRVTLVTAFLCNLLSFVCSAGSDQAAIQRLLTTRDAAAARRAYLLSNLASGTMSCLLGLVGAALLAFYRLRPELVPDHLTVAQNGDAFFPHYVGHFLPAGISGLMVACILASAMSCLAAGLNATVTVISRDFLAARENRPGMTEASRVRDSRRLTLALGLVVIAAGIGVGAVRGDLVEMSSKTVNLLFAPIFGLFFLAMFVRFATPFGAMMGAIYSSAAATLVGFWDVFTGQPPVSFLLIVIVSLAVSLLVGTGLSLLPTRGKRWPAVAAWAVVCLAPLAAGVAWLVAWGIRTA